MAATASNPPSSDSLPIATMIHMISIKLTSGNYLLWKRQVIPMLTSFELLGFIDGSKPTPSPTSLSPSGESVPNPAYTKWLTTDQRLLAVLFSSLSEEAMAEVIECATSRDAWIALEAAYAHSSTSRVNQLREELLSLRRGSLSVKDYGARFKGLCDQLSAVGKPVEDSDKSHWFLRGLGAAFANFADARMSMQPISSFPPCFIKQYNSILCRKRWIHQFPHRLLLSQSHPATILHLLRLLLVRRTTLVEMVVVMEVVVDVMVAVLVEEVAEVVLLESLIVKFAVESTTPISALYISLVRLRLQQIWPKLSLLLATSRALLQIGM